MPPSTPNGNSGAAFRARATPSTCTPPAAGGGKVTPLGGTVGASTAPVVDCLGPSLGPPRQTGGAGSDVVADGVDDGSDPVDGTGGSGRTGKVGRPGEHSIANALDG